MSQEQKNPPPARAIPPDDLKRKLKVARPETDDKLPHIGIVADTYTDLLSSTDTNGQYCLIDMYTPPGGGPPPHRHDFEESFSILEGEIEFTFRSERTIVRVGETIHIPANAPHSFRNVARKPARHLCLCSPAGQEEFFKAVGVPLANRTQAPPKPDAAAEAAFKAKAEALAPKYRTELLMP